MRTRTLQDELAEVLRDLLHDIENTPEAMATLSTGVLSAAWAKVEEYRSQAC